MGIFFSYVFLGLTLAAPIGPVNAAQLDKGIRSGFWHAWLVGIGAMTADLIYMFTVYLGIVQFLEVPIVKIFLWSFGFFVLIYTGIESIINVRKIEINMRNRSDSAIKSFSSGFLLSITNPLTILFWLGIFGSVLAKTASQYDHIYLFTYSFAIILGLLIWDVAMAAISSIFRRYLSGKILAGISIFSGVSLIGFGVYFGYQAVLILFF